MANAWPTVPLGEVLTQYQEYIEAPEPRIYPKLSVKLYGKGVVLDTSVDGSSLKMKRHQIAKSGQVILSEIWGKRGAIGFVPAEGNGALCTSHFFLFDVRHDKVDPKYLQLIFEANYLQDQLDAEAKGTTGYAAVRPKNLLAAKIPLPPLEEQRRIVARIEALAAKIEEAKRLRRQALEEVDRLLITMAHRGDLDEATKLRNGWIKIKLGDVIRQVEDVHPVCPDSSYSNLGIYSFGKGLFKKPPIQGLSTSAKALYRVRADQFIYNRLFAFEGAYGIVSDEFDGYFVSNEYPTFECDTGRVKVEFLYAYFKSPSIWSEVATGSKGLGDRRQRVHPTQVLNHHLMLPPLEWQNRIALVTAKTDTLKRLQTGTAAELDAILPSMLDKAFKGSL